MRIVQKTSYGQDTGLFRTRRDAGLYALLLLAAVALPLAAGPFLLGEAANVLIFAVAGLGLMILVGLSGQVSLGHAAFLAVGCYANILAQTRLGLPFLLSLPFAALVSAAAGALLAVPVAKLHGIYLAIATLAVAILVENLIVIAAPLTGGVAGIAAPDIRLPGITINRYVQTAPFYWVVLAVFLLCLLVYRNVERSPLGRSFAAIRDSEVSARAIGVNVARTKAVAFALSAGMTGVAGALLGHFTGYVNHESFNIVLSITLLLMIVVGGLGTAHGAVLGAIVVALMPQVIAIGRDLAAGLLGLGTIVVPGLETAVFAALLVAVILFEPLGLYGRWVKIRTYGQLFPFYRRGLFRRQRGYLRTERMR